MHRFSAYILQHVFLEEIRQNLRSHGRMLLATDIFSHFKMRRAAIPRFLGLTSLQGKFGGIPSLITKPLPNC
jgi:hypothetical protein